MFKVCNCPFAHILEGIKENLNNYESTVCKEAGDEFRPGCYALYTYFLFTLSHKYCVDTSDQENFYIEY